MPKLTNEEFISKVGLVCPACSKSDISSMDSVQIDDGFCWQEIECHTCEATWQEIYNLVGFDNLQTDEMR